MNEQLQNRLLEFLDKALNGIDESVSFMSEQLPDYINQLLVWYAVIGSLKFIAALLIPFTCYKVMKKLLKKLPEKPKRGGESNWFWDAYEYSEASAGVGGIFSCIGLAAVLFVSLVTAIKLFNTEWLQILIAPKVWLVEYASKLAG